jgi:cation diffusion facilitator family transporter
MLTDANSTQVRDDSVDRRHAVRAMAVSAIGLAATAGIEMAFAIITGSVALLGDALHNLSDVSTSAVMFAGFAISKKPATRRYPYGYERAEDLAGLGVALVVWLSALFAGYESYHKLVHHEATSHVGAGMAAAVLGIVGNQLVARYKLRVGRRIRSATLVADAKHSWMDALSSAGALLGLALVAAGWWWGDPIAGFAVTLFIVHVGIQVTRELTHHLMDGIEPEDLDAAEHAAQTIPGVRGVNARGRWTGRTLTLDIDTSLEPHLTLEQATSISEQVTAAVQSAVPTATHIHIHPSPNVGSRFSVND